LTPVSELVIEVRGLTKRYGVRGVVDSVSFDVYRGEVSALIGPNGSGKTTVIRMLRGLLEPTDGEARVLGYDFGSEAEQIKQHIGYVSQRFSLYQDLSVMDNPSFYARVYGVPRGERRARLDELIAMCGLSSSGARQCSIEGSSDDRTERGAGPGIRDPLANPAPQAP
jgi:ABC-2 type transport system ATP-binding protein